jgi:Na+/proline symporter
MAMYPISLAIMVISIVLLFISRNKNKKEDKWSRPTRNGGWSVMTLVTGILCIISAIAWIYSIQSFKTQLAE